MFELNEDNTFGQFSASHTGKKPAGHEQPSEGVYEAAITDFAESQLRAEAMGIALTFVDDGEFTGEQLDALLIGFVTDGEDEDELDDDQAAQYDALAETLVDAFVALGGSKSNAEAAVGGDDEAANDLGEFLAEKMEENSKSDDEIVSKFAVETGMIFESKKRVIRGGKVSFIKKRTRKVRLSAAQRAALKKARKKAHTSAAKRARLKSMRVRRSRGM
ncbi:MAG: hypothetical protein IBX50_04220 [Marinospirillum sp.]|uniref:hypothetical protein n=1 Tax=Marinospirillum sp. TaxID=2183934 RepID=UPI0019E708CE|nr:hypothetical protein [Marinospirillum sp.]MBE0505912.1 hypothetical protein [Marinospirillum sp.]